MKVGSRIPLKKYTQQVQQWSQNYKNLEIIVVNDNSTDNTEKIVKKFKKNFKKLRLIQGKELPSGWVGKTWALKQGVDLAVQKNNDYLLFLDST